MERGTLVNRPSVGGTIIAAVIETKRVGTCEYARIGDEFGAVYLLPVSLLTERSAAGRTVGENDREIAALRTAIDYKA